MRILLVGDGVRLTTGFAQVLRQMAQEFVQRGHEVHQLAALEIGPTFDTEAYRKLGVTPYMCNSYDHVGRNVIGRAYELAQPDVVFLNCDPGTADIWRRQFGQQLPRDHAPVVAYLPVEGAPLAPNIVRGFQWPEAVYTCTAWGSQVLKEQCGLDVPWVWHGVDTSVFKPLTEGDRRAVRRQLGWDGKFVVMYVGRNAGRKAQDRLIKAVSQLKANGIDDVLLYLHCVPYDDHQLQGFDLAGIAHWCGVTGEVQFADQANAALGERQVSLVQKYGAADLYVHAAKVEGFGLPILEAMACGLPVVIPADEGNMQEIAGIGSLATIKPVEWETWFNGAQLAHVLPESWAAIIDWARQHPKECRAAGERARERAQAFSWQVMRTTLADATEKVATRQKMTELASYAG